MLPGCEVCGALGHTSSHCTAFAGRASTSVPVDFDEAGRQLLARLESDVAHPHDLSVQACSRTRTCTCPLCDRDQAVLAEVLLPSRFSPMSVIWRSSESSGAVFVGSLAAARDVNLLQQAGITHVVNCMCQPTRMKHPGLQYYHFPVEQWKSVLLPNARVDIESRMSLNGLTPRDFQDVLSSANSTAVLELCRPAVQFIQEAADTGGRVLIHCFAGAHRAGTTVVAFLMHVERLGAETATTVAQRMRPCIDPKAHGDLHTMLRLLEMALAPDVKG